jgi:hypothetical protein
LLIADWANQQSAINNQQFPFRTTNTGGGRKFPIADFQLPFTGRSKLEIGN